VHISLPPLRERREDVPELMRHFLHRHALAYGVEPLQLDEEAQADLLAHDWPGNVRELSNVIERLYALGKGPVIRRADLCDQVRCAARTRVPKATENIPSWEEAERSLILQALRACNGQKVAAARLLKIDRHRLMRKLRKYNIA
jgi:DNA-binding NtrC family response regulator